MGFKDLSQAWTVESLAEQAAMSRSSFSNKFNQLIGNAPLQYLTHLRMQCAYQKLLRSNESIIGIALSHGYQSEAAFSKVLKDIMVSALIKPERKNKRDIFIAPISSDESYEYTSKD